MHVDRAGGIEDNVGSNENLRAAEEDAGKEHAVRLRGGWNDVCAVKRLQWITTVTADPTQRLRIMADLTRVITAVTAEADHTQQIIAKRRRVL